MSGVQLSSSSPMVLGEKLGHVFPLFYCCWTCSQPAKAPVLNICGHIFCYNCSTSESYCPACHSHLDAKSDTSSTIAPVYSGIETYRKYDCPWDDIFLLQNEDREMEEQGEDESEEEGGDGQEEQEERNGEGLEENVEWEKVEHEDDLEEKELEDDDEREEVEQGDEWERDVDEEMKKNIELAEKREADFRRSTPIHPAFWLMRQYPNPTMLIFSSIYKFKDEVLEFRFQMGRILRNALTGRRVNLVEEICRYSEDRMKTLLEVMVKNERRLMRHDKKTGTWERPKKKPLMDSDVAIEKLCFKDSDEGTCTCSYLKAKIFWSADSEQQPIFRSSCDERDHVAFNLLMSQSFTHYRYPSNRNGFMCNICKVTSSEPIITFCGHLFCWPCIYSEIATSKFLSGPCPTCGHVVHVSRSRSNVNPVSSLTNGEVENAILWRGRRLFHEDDKIAAIPPRPSFHHHSSRFMGFVLKRVKDCAANVETKMKRLHQEWFSLKPNEIEALCREIQNLMDETFVSLVKSWRSYMGEDHDEYELRPSFYDASHTSFVTDKTQWMQMWEKLTILGRTYCSSTFRMEHERKQNQQASRSKTPLESALAFVSDSGLTHSDNAINHDHEAACIEDKLEVKIKKNTHVMTTSHLHVPEKESAHVSIPSCLVEPAISKDNIDLADSQAATSHLNLSHSTADSAAITPMDAPSLNSQQMESSADIWLVQNCDEDIVEKSFLLLHHFVSTIPVFFVE